MIEELIADCSTIKVSSTAADAYAREWTSLAALVSAHIDADPRSLTLTGASPTTVRHASLEFRASLMKSLFRLDSCELLARTIAWEYGAQHARGFSFDYFPFEFAAWKAILQKKLEPPCAEEIIAVYEWMLRHHESIVRLSMVGEGLGSPVGHGLSESQEALLTLLLRGDSKGCLDLVDRTIRSEGELKRFYLEVISPVLYRVGLLWEKNEISVADEHLATAIVGRIIAALYFRFARAGVIRGKALVAAGPYELHDIGARMVADFLEMEGWDVTYPGGNLSGEEILSMVKDLNPFVITLSASSILHLDAARQLIREIKWECPKVRVLLGGFAFNAVPGLWLQMGADGCQKDAAGAAAAVNAWWEQRGL